MTRWFNEDGVAARAEELGELGLIKEDETDTADKADLDFDPWNP